jgi:hypothetical protein
VRGTGAGERGSPNSIDIEVALPRFHRPRVALLGVVSLLVLAAACAESIEAGAGCPVLCPIENEAVRDTVLEGVALDTTLTGFPFPGEQTYLLVALHPGADSVDVRAVIRFDSLPKRFFPSGGADSADITTVDSSFLRFRVDTLGLRLDQAVTLEAYDVDTAPAVDTAAVVLAALFRPDRLLGSLEVTRASITGDSLRLPIANTALAAKARDGKRLRVGLRLRGAAPGQIRLFSAAGGASTSGARLSFDPSTDTTYTPIVLDPASATPEANSEIAAGLQDFTFAATGADAPRGAELAVGGVPGRRALLRFEIPARLIDSTTIVRATLRLVQQPTAAGDPADTVILATDVVVANESITDIQRIVALTSAGRLFGVDSLRIVPSDSGARELSLINLVRAWRVLPEGTQRAIILRASLEGAQASALRFFSAEAAPALRPRLQISYIPRTNFGLP